MHAGVNKNSLIRVAAVAIFVYGMTASLAGTIAPQLSRRLNLTPDQIGNVFLAQAIGMIIASVCAGPLVDNKGKKTGLALALGLIIAALFALPSSGSRVMLFVCMIVLGVGGGVLVTASNALVSDIDPKKRATILTLLKVFFGVGGFATAFLGASLLGGNTITLCYVIACITVATLALVFATAIPAPSGSRGFKISEVGLLTGQPLLYLFSLMVFLYVACEVGMFNWLAKHLIAQGMTEANALKVVSLGLSMGLIIGRLIFAGILIKVPAITTTLIGSISMAVTTYAMLQVTDPLAAGAVAFLAGVAMAPIFPAALAMTGDKFTRMTATAMGVVITSGWIGLAVSSRLIGAIAGPDPQGIRTGLMLLPVFSVLMIALNLVIRPLLGPARGAVQAAVEEQAKALSHKSG